MLDFATFYGQCYERTYRGLTLALGDRAVAEDATQEAFYRALRHWRKVSTLDRPEAWVLVVGLNAGRDVYRKAARERRLPVTVGAGPGSGAEVQVDDRMLLGELLGALPDRQRQALVLRYVGGLPLVAVAEAMGIAEGTVKATLHQALENLQRRSHHG